MHTFTMRGRNDPSMPLPASRLEAIFDRIMDLVCVIDEAGNYVYLNAACEKILGYTRDELLGSPMMDLVHLDDRARTLATADRVIQGEQTHHFENRYIRKDGKIAHLLWSAGWSEDDRLRIGVARDITSQQHAVTVQSALLAISEAAHTAVDAQDLFKRIHDIVGDLLPATNFFVALYDQETDVLSFPYFVDEHDTRPESRPLDSGTLSAEVIRSGQALLLTPHCDESVRHRIKSIHGHAPIDWLGVPLTGEKGVIGALAVQSYNGDVRYTEQDKQLLQYVSTQVAAAIERKRTQDWLRHIAEHDPLTHLPNRALFDDRLQTAIARAERDSQHLALLYLDLDHFKSINDTLGHAVGDQLLLEVAQRLSRSVRASDTVARMGGDEFVVLLMAIKDPDHAVIVAEKILDALQKPFNLDSRQLCVTASLGIAVYPDHGTQSQQLIREADHAMYRAKKCGGNLHTLAGVAPHET
jgi:diguanylate cyclase (GGDEF)-like protein/PAS domain S-box-containing protein